MFADALGVQSLLIGGLGAWLDYVGASEKACADKE